MSVIPLTSVVRFIIIGCIQVVILFALTSRGRTIDLVKMVVELPYSLHTRYASIAIAWTIILVPPTIINLGIFYYLLHSRGQLDLVVLTVPTAVLGVFTVIGIIERVWKLIRPSNQYRPIKAARYTLDVFQWGYFASLILISALISSTLARGDADEDGHDLQLRLVSLPAAVLTFFLATLTLISLILNGLNVRLPFRFGSVPAGNVLRPAIYYIVEDVVAVDGFGGLEYREAFAARYDSSPTFRRMIRSLSIVWMAAFFLIAVGLTFLIFNLPLLAVYPVGWVLPFLLAGLLTIWTIFYVQSMLRQERKIDQSEDGTVDEYTSLLP